MQHQLLDGIPVPIFIDNCSIQNTITKTSFLDSNSPEPRSIRAEENKIEKTKQIPCFGFNCKNIKNEINFFKKRKMEHASVRKEWKWIQKL